MYGLDSCDDDSSAPKGLESEHRWRNPFDGTVILFNDIAEVLVLMHQDINAGVGLNAPNDRRVGAALVNGDLLWHIVQVDGALQKPSGSSQMRLATRRKSTVSPTRSTAR